MARSLPLAFLIVAACGDARSRDSEPMVEYTRTDSAGVEIVQYSTFDPAALEQWEIGSEPTTDVGVEERGPEHIWKLATGVVRMPDGRVIIAVDETEMLSFDSTGAFVSRIGRKGSGPGEFTGYFSLHGIRGDSLFAYQHSSQRVTIFAPTGEYVRSSRVVRPSAQGEYSEFAAFEFNQVFPDGSLLLNRHGGERQLEPGTTYSDSVRLLRIGADGELLTDFGTRWRRDETRVKAIGTVSGGPPPAGWESTFHFPRSAVFGVAGDHLFMGASDSFAVELWSMHGQLKRVIRIATDPVRRLPGEGEEMSSMGMRYDLKAVAPSVYPPINAGFGDTEGNLWLSVHPRVFSDSLWRFIVFDTTGVAHAAVRWPDQRPSGSNWRFLFNWIAIDSTHLTVIALDPEDRAHGLALPIRKRAAGALR